MGSSDSCESLVARCAVGDVDALAGLYDHFGATAYGLARRMAGEDARAEAVVEAAFLDAWREARSFDPARGKVSTWLLSLVHRRALEAVRGERGRVPNVTGERGRALIGEGAPSGAEGEAARAAFAQLEPEDRRVIELAYLEGYTRAEMAALLGEPRASVSSRLYAALTTLRDLLAAVRT